MSLEQIDLLFTGEKVLLCWRPSMGGQESSLVTPDDEKTAPTDRFEA